MNIEIKKDNRKLPYIKIYTEKRKSRIEIKLYKKILMRIDIKQEKQHFTGIDMKTENVI